MKLSKRAIDQATYHGKKGTDHYLWDDAITGFGVRLYAFGRKSFVVSHYKLLARPRVFSRLLPKEGALKVAELEIGVALEDLPEGTSLPCWTCPESPRCRRRRTGRRSQERAPTRLEGALRLIS